MSDDIGNENESIFSLINKYTSLPTVKALVPFNSVKIPSYYMGSVLTSDQRFERNDAMQPWRNIESSLEYLSSSHNDTHYNTRFKKFLFDTAVVNGMCEIPSDIGSTFAGSYANEMGAQYTNEIVEDEINKPLETQFSCELRLRGGPGSKSGSNSTSTTPLFNGVGLFKEHLPVSGRTNPLFGPTLPVRKDRPIWSYKFFDGKGGAFIMPNSDLVIRFPTGNLLRKIVFRGSGSKIFNRSLDILLLLSYIRYAMFIKKFIAIYGIKYVNLFRTNSIRIVLKCVKSILNKIGDIRHKIRRKRKVKKPLV